MARARNIKPAFFKNADLVETSFETRLLFVGLWTLADREGRLQDRPKQIKMELFPADNVDVDACLNDLAQFGFITRYVADGKRVIQIVNFSKHQTPHGKEADSELPDEHGIYTVHERNKSGLVTGNISTRTSQAQCKHSASTVPEQCEHTLIPESPFLNPESVLNDNSGDLSTVGESAPPPSSSVNPIQSRAIELAVMIRKRGGAVNADDPHILSWANSGVTDAQALTALETAKHQRASKGDISPINSGYLNSILQNQINPQAKARASPHNGGLSAKDAERKRVADQMFRRGEYAEPKREIDITGTAVVLDGQAVRAIRGDVRAKLD